MIFIRQMENGVGGEVAAHMHHHQSNIRGNSTIKLVLLLHSKTKDSKQLGDTG